MTPDRWKQIDDLYRIAVDSGEEARAAILAQAAPEVRDTVVEMLAQHSGGHILDRPAWEGEAELLNSTVAPLTAGTQLGPYQIAGILGEGGMGAVYRAFDSRLSRDVAVKILPPAVAGDPERLRRFEQEARAAGTLNHPNILTIYDVGTHDGTSYLVSELLEGQTLRDRLRGGPLPRRKALEYACLIAAGLTAAHERGITHRDLKPENLFITRDGRLKILDFGLAKFTAAPVPEGMTGDTLALGSQPGTILGTVGYMSPEQVQAGAVDHRSDLFNLGAILYEMLTGQRAFHGSTPIETLHSILKEEPQLSDDDPNLGPGLTRLLRHCLEKDPRERFQSAKDLAFDLEALELPQSAAVRPTGTPRWKIAVGVMSVLALILYVAGREIGRPQPVRPASFRQITFRSGNIAGGRFTRDRDGQTIVYSAAWDGKPMETFEGRADRPESRQLDVPGAPSTGVLAISANGELALTLGCTLNEGECRGTIARMPPTGGAPREVLQDGDSADWDLKGNLAVVRPYQGRFRVEYPIGKVLYENTTGWISHLRFSPKGDRIAFLNHPRFGDNDGSVEVVDLSGHKTTLAAARKGLKGLAWTPAGDELWFSGSSTARTPVLSAVTLAGKERVVLQTPGWTEIMDIAPDGRVLLLRQNPRTNVIYRSPGASKDRSLSWFDWSTSADLSSDGRTLLFSEWGEAAGGIPIVHTRHTEGGDAIRLGEGKALALAPDQKWVLALKTGSPPELILLPTGAGESKVLPLSGIQDYYSGAFFPDGKRILFAGEGSDHVPRSFVQDFDGGKARAVTAEGMRATLISPDGKRLAAYGPNENYYLTPADGGRRERIRGTELGDELIQWGDDGRYLYVRGANETIVELFRIDLVSGQRKPWKTLEVPDNVGFVGLETGPGATRITPDGKSFVYTYWQARGELYIAEGLK